MTDQEIFTKAIKVAEANDPSFDYTECIPELEEPGTIDVSLSDYAWVHRYSIIFNHRFAKALWGEDRIWNVAEGEEGDKTTDYSGYLILYWQGMLQQMVVADDPIKYLGNNLPEQDHD